MRFFFISVLVFNTDIDKITKIPKLFHIHNDIQFKN